MTVRDAKKPPPSGSSQEAWDRWFNETVWEKLNLDTYPTLGTPAASDKVLIFDNSADATKGITLTNLFSQSLLKTALGVVVGDWTPALGASGTSGTHTYAVQFGRYCYVAALNRIWADYHMDITTKDSSGTTSGNLQISGLPYASNATSGYRAVSPFRYSSIDLNVGAARYSALGVISNNSQVILLQEMGDNVAAANLTDADFANGSIIVGSISYETA